MMLFLLQKMSHTLFLYFPVCCANLSPVTMYAGRGSDKNQSYMNTQQCFHFRGSRLRIAVAGCGICGTLFLIRSLTDFFRDPLAAGGNCVPLPRTWKQRFTADFTLNWVSGAVFTKGLSQVLGLTFV